MEIESKVFAKSKPNKEALLSYGFVEEERGLRYQEIFFDGEFKADILVLESGEVEGHVLELAMDEEEFAPLRIDSYGGGYVGSVREAYRELLKRIKKQCFVETLFLSPQTNRITAEIARRYGEKPDFPWDEDFGVFRFPENRKWYGLVMDIPKKKLTHNEADEEMVNVMNLKINGPSPEELFKRPGIFPAYHMNHQKWLSVLLNDTLSDEEVMELVNASRESILPKKKVQK